MMEGYKAEAGELTPE
jgi:acetyl esterase